MRRALVTGGTDGIGRASAEALAQAGYAVDILGRDEARGAAVLAALEATTPGVHRLFRVDLAKAEATARFLRDYRAATPQLDVLVLNANAFAETLVVTGDGMERTFQVGAASRLQFAIALDPLLRAQAPGRVVHVGAMHRMVARTAHRIRYGRLDAPNFGPMRAVWQAFAASGLMVYFLPDWLDSPVSHEGFDPGVVATRQLTERGLLVRGLTHLFARVRSPEVIGQALSDHLAATTGAQMTGRYTRVGAPLATQAPLLAAQPQFEAFVEFCRARLGAAWMEPDRS